ncbi:MAG: hypothetical protein U0324_05335 [Polyangiales bacterium]
MANCHEAILAWHRGDAAGLAVACERARSIEGATAEPRTWSVLQAMAADLGVAPLDSAAREALVERAAAHVPAIALQVAALTLPEGALDPREADRAVRLARSIPRARWAERLDVLSVDECLARLGAAPPGQ